MPPPVRRKLTSWVLVVGAALALAAVAHAGNGGFAPVTPHSPNAGRINETYKLISIFTGIIFVVVEASLLWFVFRYRRRGRPRDAEGPQIHGATRLELIWTAVPVVILAIIVSFVLYKLPGIRNAPAASSADPPLNIRVDGHQFYWQFTYPDGHASIQELHAPVNRVVELDIQSQDVAHSWWIPALGGKFDAIPGVTNHTWFKADQAGTYRGQCGEFCGVFHAEMVGRVVAEPQAAYDAYVANLANPLTLGGQEWRGVCATCHGMEGQGGYGPPLATNQILVQKQTLEHILLNGQNVRPPVSSYMPPVARGWSAFQLQALEAYLKKAVYKGSSSGG
jgi:cytochrome c oxidase subunit II